jgi:hypothetical protein
MTERIALVAIAQAMLACVQLGKLMDHSYILTDAENNAVINPRENIFLYYDDVATQVSQPDPVSGLKIPVFREASVNEIDTFKNKYRDSKGVPVPIAVTSEAVDAPYYSKAPGLLKTFENKALTGGGAASAQDFNKFKRETKGSSLPLLLGVAAAGLVLYSQNK